ncbi:SpoIIIAH-like family protein [Phosphitispora sp. TUW77]|uniref:SpoIIIAH-like family protein n=1 Tax=Phosphitispora sp. TUW77 TaxID=3152361 RepID=UPI003AB8A779
MNMLFVNKKGLWMGLFMLGVFLIAVGLFQIKEYQSDRNIITGDASGDIITEDAASGDIISENTAVEDKGGEYNGAFFVEYRLERDRTRSQQIDLLREIVNNGNSSTEIRNEAQMRLLSISQAIDTEMKLENLIIAESFKDAVVFVEEKSVTIIVQSPVLTEPDKEKLTAISARVTGINAENIAVFTKL